MGNKKGKSEIAKCFLCVKISEQYADTLSSYTKDDHDEATNDSAISFHDSAIIGEYDYGFSSPSSHDVFAEYSAQYVLSNSQRLFIFLFLFLIIFFHIIDYQTAIVLFINSANFLYMCNIAFKFALIRRSLKLKRYSKTPYITASSSETVITSEYDNLPFYTIMLPMYKEANVLNQLLSNIGALNYPNEKLLVLLVIESDDSEMRNMLSEMKLPSNYVVVVVPDDYPKTKARACNYALKYAKGDYLVIYDAEDCPDANQLLFVSDYYSRYNKNPQNTKRLACVQCKLNYYNANENWLTKMFNVEYSILFNHILCVLSSLFLPIPLGGSSNHFDLSILRELGGWDDYNVTEDAEIGMRFALNDFNVQIADSYTYEEAPIEVMGWIKQRARWIKGHLMTYLIYMRSPSVTLDKFGTLGFMTFSYIMGASILALFCAPIIFFIMFLFFTSIIIFFVNDFTELSSIFVFFIGIFFICYNSYIIVNYDYKERGIYLDLKEKLLLVLTFPFYLVLHNVAAIVALYELFVRPHHWNKTEHGLTKLLNDDVKIS